MPCGSSSAMEMTPSRGRALDVPVGSSLGRWRRRWQCGRCDTPLAEVAQRLRFSHRLPWPRTLTAEAVQNGVFPLVTNDRKLTEQALLVAYKGQPVIERRFAQLKTEFE